MNLVKTEKSTTQHNFFLAALEGGEEMITSRLFKKILPASCVLMMLLEDVGPAPILGDP